MQYLTLFSVPYRDGHIYALVPGFDPLRRLMADDPVWSKPTVYQHWVHVAFPDKTRARIVDRIKFRHVQ